MEKVATSYSDTENAWVSEELSVHRNVYLTINLVNPGKVVIRQNCGDDKWYRVPIKRHKDNKSFCFRIRIPSHQFKLKIFTSTQPKEICYAYI